jgi:RNA-directed DNA polymerase
LIVKFLEKQIKFPLYAQGGIKKRSIITNAKMHCNKKYVATFDIKDFFPSVNLNKVERIIVDNFNFPADLLSFIKRLVTFKCCIPQGAPVMSTYIWRFFQDRYILMDEYIYANYN